jgi:hypothetical protein
MSYEITLHIAMSMPRETAAERQGFMVKMPTGAG